MISEYKVYIKINSQNCITAINSSAFLSSLDGWQEIDSGIGDKYHHAQGNYLDKPLYDERKIFRYKFVNGAVVERTQEEMDADYAARPTPRPSAQEILRADVDYLLMMQDS